MSKPKHTKGPWRVSQGENEGDIILNSDNLFSKKICRVSRFDDFEANASLIAAAPDMLNVLETVYCNCNVLYNCEDYCFMNKVQDIINRAKGL